MSASTDPGVMAVLPRQAQASDDSDRPTSWRHISLFLLTACGVIACFLFTHVLLFSIIGAITIAIVTHPLAEWLNRRFSRTWAATLLILVVAIAVLLPLFLILRDLIGEVLDLIRSVQSGAAEQAVRRMAQNHQKLGGLVQRILQQLALEDLGQQTARIAAKEVGAGVRLLAKGITDSVLLLFFLFFLVRDRESAVRGLQAIVPLRPADTHDLLRQMAEVVQAIFSGRILIALIQGILAGLAYLLLGVPGSLLWGSVTMLCCLIPAFGAFVAWVPIALYLGLSQSWTKAAILAVWGGLVVGNIDNFLYPVMVGKKTDLHTAVIFVAIFGGLAFFGVSGFVLGPVIVAATISLLRIWKRSIQAPGSPI